MHEVWSSVRTLGNTLASIYSSGRTLSDQLVHAWKAVTFVWTSVLVLLVTSSLGVRFEWFKVRWICLLILFNIGTLNDIKNSWILIYFIQNILQYIFLILFDLRYFPYLIWSWSFPYLFTKSFPYVFLILFLQYVEQIFSLFVFDRFNLSSWPNICLIWPLLAHLFYKAQISSFIFKSYNIYLISTIILDLSYELSVKLKLFQRVIRAPPAATSIVLFSVEMSP